MGTDMKRGSEFERWAFPHTKQWHVHQLSWKWSVFVSSFFLKYEEIQASNHPNCWEILLLNCWTKCTITPITARERLLWTSPWHSLNWNWSIKEDQNWCTKELYKSCTKMHQLSEPWNCWSGWESENRRERELNNGEKDETTMRGSHWSLENDKVKVATGWGER